MTGARATNKQNTAGCHDGDQFCRARGCQVVVAALSKAYNVRKRICPEHITAERVLLDREQHGDMLFRFCHQCGKFEPLAEFEGSKRSCRKRLLRRRAGQHQERSKPLKRAKDDSSMLTSDDEQHHSTSAEGSHSGQYGSLNEQYITGRGESSEIQILQEQLQQQGRLLQLLRHSGAAQPMLSENLGYDGVTAGPASTGAATTGLEYPIAATGTQQQRQQAYQKQQKLQPASSASTESNRHHPCHMDAQRGVNSLEGIVAFAIPGSPGTVCNAVAESRTVHNPNQLGTAIGQLSCTPHEPQIQLGSGSNAAIDPVWDEMLQALADGSVQTDDGLDMSLLQHFEDIEAITRHDQQQQYWHQQQQQTQQQQQQQQAQDSEGHPTMQPGHRNVNSRPVTEAAICNGQRLTMEHTALNMQQQLQVTLLQQLSHQQLPMPTGNATELQDTHHMQQLASPECAASAGTLTGCTTRLLQQQSNQQQRLSVTSSNGGDSPPIPAPTPSLAHAATLPTAASAPTLAQVSSPALAQHATVQGLVKLQRRVQEMSAHLAQLQSEVALSIEHMVTALPAANHTLPQRASGTLPAAQPTTTVSPVGCQLQQAPSASYLSAHTAPLSMQPELQHAWAALHLQQQRQ